MAGEKITIVSGAPISIRVTAAADAAEGDYIYLHRVGSGNTAYGGTAGFWLHDTKKDEVGDVCIYAPIVEIPNTAGNNGQPGAVKAGQVHTGDEDGIVFAGGVGARRTLYRNSTYTVAIIYEDAPATSDRIKVVWGLH